MYRNSADWNAWIFCNTERQIFPFSSLLRTRGQQYYNKTEPRCSCHIVKSDATCLEARGIFHKNISGNIIFSKCDTANKSYNGVVKFRRYYLGKTRLFYIHLRGFPPRPIYVSGYKTNADKCGNKMNIRFISTLTKSAFVLVAKGGERRCAAC